MKYLIALIIAIGACVYADTIVTTSDGKKTVVPGDMVSLEIVKPKPVGQTIPTTDLPGWKLVYTDNFDAWRWNDWQYPQGFQYEHSWVGGVTGLSNSLMDITAARKDGDAEMVVGWAQLTNNPKAVQTYGKYLVRMRADKVSGVPVAVAALLWPAGTNVQWPQDGEIDFAEDFDGTRAVHAFSHYADSTGAGQQTWNDADKTISMNDWHIWGVEWTPSSLKYTLDGKVWATVTDKRAIPTKPMYLGFVQACHVDCPVGVVHWQTDWIAVYSYQP